MTPILLDVKVTTRDTQAHSCCPTPVGAVPPTNVGGSVQKSLWLTLEELFAGGLHHVVAQVYAMDQVSSLVLRDDDL